MSESSADHPVDPPSVPPPRHVSLSTVLALTNRSVDEIWLGYATLGGEHSSDGMVAHLAGAMEWSAMEQNILAHVLNEHLIDQGIGPLADYSP